MQCFLHESGFCFTYLFFAFYAEIRNGHQKWGENDFWEKSPVDSADNLRVKNFVQIALSSSISKINGFCVLRRNSRWPPKVAGKQFLRKTPVDSADTLRIKNFVEIALSCSVSEINTISVLCRNSRWPPKVAGKRFLQKVASRPCRYHAGQKFKMAAKSGWKTMLRKVAISRVGNLWVKNFVKIA